MLKRLFFVFSFSAAFAYLEAVTVIYFQQLLGIIGAPGVAAVTPQTTLLDLRFLTLLQPDAASVLIPFPPLLNLELFRQFAALVMLIALAFFAGRSLSHVLAFFFFSLGISGIVYYLVLRLIVAWPTGLSERDIFFLIPVAWVGPVATPLTLSLISILLSTIYLSRKAK